MRRCYRIICLGAIAIALGIPLVGCVDVATRPLADDTAAVQAAPLPRGNDPIIQHLPYPIHLRWYRCEGDLGCTETIRQVPKDSILPDIAEAMEKAVAKWAEVLAPTLPEEFVIPTRRNGEAYRWRCRYDIDKDLVTGDTLPAGFTVNLVYSVRQGGVSAGHCGIDHLPERGWHDVWDGKSPMGTITWTPDQHSESNWYRIALHELGHLFGAVASGKYGDAHQISADSTMAWLTDSTIVAAFDKAGGAGYPGKKVPVTVFCSGCHWHPCVAKGDIMGSVWLPNNRITDLTIASLFPGYVAVPQGGLDSDAHTLWETCPEIKSSGVDGVADRQDPLVGDSLEPPH